MGENNSTTADVLAAVDGLLTRELDAGGKPTWTLCPP